MRVILPIRMGIGPAANREVGFIDLDGAHSAEDIDREIVAFLRKLADLWERDSIANKLYGINPARDLPPGKSPRKRID